ncbi:hypothetical protein DY000_02000629 [Brassica cretica]|uniref:F-box domain-containing protein n=1 Tax=Brassica cretica TaxID=69181 RepID=A0ABQ7C4I7_BRACR|nr:hypothetical protein DY000_02000629 [Brassica cretica]
MANLPMDTVANVFHRLPATTLVRCRVLSKPCCSLIDSPDFIASHLKRTLETEDHLMILLRTYLRLPLFNPSTRKIHRLPVEPIDFYERHITREYVFYGLGHDSVSDDYKVRIDLLSEDVEILFDNFYFHLLYRRGNGVLASNSLHWILIHNEGDIGMNTIIKFHLATEELGVVNFSHDVYVKGMDIGVLDGCLCMMCYNEVRHADVWIMREYGGEWSKFVSVPQPESVVSFEFVRPLIYSKDRRKILLEINNGKLFWFDLGSKSLETLVIKGCESLPCNAEIVVSSLVLGCKGDSRRARENKMVQKGNKRRDDFLSKGFKLKL